MKNKVTNIERETLSCPNARLPVRCFLCESLPAQTGRIKNRRTLVRCRMKSVILLKRLAEEKNDSRLLSLLSKAHDEAAAVLNLQYHPHCFQTYTKNARSAEDVEISSTVEPEAVGFTWDTCDSLQRAEDSSLHQLSLKTDPVNINSNNHLESMVATLVQFRADHFLCDALILVDDGELQAHSVILSAASPIFKVAFSTPNTRQIKLPNVKLEVMKLAFDAIYTGRIECENSNKSDVTDLLVKFEVDVSKLEGNNWLEKRKDKEVSFNSADESMLAEPTICFNSIEELKCEMDNITDAAVDDTASQLGHEMTSQSDEGDFGNEMASQSDEGNVDELTDCGAKSDKDTNPFQRKNQKKTPSSLLLNEQVCNCGIKGTWKEKYQCRSVTPEQKKQLHEQFEAMCYRRQSLMLASLVDTDKYLQKKPESKAGSKEKLSTKFTYRLPNQEAGNHIRVCRETFFSVFWISNRRLYNLNKVLSGKNSEERWGRKMALPYLMSLSNVKQYETSDEVTVSNIESETKHLILDNADVMTTPSNQASQSDNKARLTIAELTAMLSADNCPCRQCKGKFPCDYCKYRAWTRKDLIVHIGFSCKKAPFGLYKWQSDQLGETQDPGMCEFDACEDGNSKQLQSNVEVDFSCRYCSNTFASLYAMKKHRLSEHTRTDAKHICDVCHLVFTTARLLKEHRDDIHRRDSKTYLCPDCGKTYNTSNSFFAHLASHCKADESKPVTCDLCPRVFKGLTTCLNHKKIVHGVIEQSLRPVVCDRCGKLFDFKSNLDRHTKKGCQDHRRIVVNVPCDKCGKHFAKNRSLVSHRRKCLLLPVIDSTRDKIVVDVCCDRCGKSFARNRSLINHRKNCLLLPLIDSDPDKI